MRWFCAVTVVVVLAVPVAASGQAPSAVEQSRIHHKNAVVHFNLDEWKEAAAEFKEAYRLHPDPLFLYNIGQCYRKMGEHAEALSYYRKYLRAAPRAANRAEVERRMDELEAALAAASKSREAPPPSVLPPATEPVAPPPAAATPAPDLAVPAPAPPAVNLVSEPAAPEPPVYKRWWFWAGVGAAVAAGVTIGILASSPRTRATYKGDLDPGRIDVP
jgi:tetratricopeptide (TPR) repeat protein